MQGHGEVGAAQWWIIVGSAALLAAAAVAYAIAPDPPPAHRVATKKSTTAVTARSAAGEPPVRIVAVRSDGAVVVLRSLTGDVERVGPHVATHGAGQIALAPNADASAAYVVDTRASVPELLFVRLADGERERVTGGSVPVTSADGRTLAFVPAATPNAIVLEDTVTNQQRPLAGGPRPFGTIDRMAFTPSGAALLVTARDSSGFDTLWRVDPSTNTLSGAQPIAVTSEPGRSVIDVTAVDDDNVVVVESCCTPDVTNGTAWRVSLTAPQNGEPLLAGTLRAVHAVDADASGRWLLFLADWTPGRGGTLWRWDGAGLPVRVADGILAAAW